jgi:hypothetical protein
MEPGPRRDLAGTELEPAPDLLVARLDLGDQIALSQAVAELRMPARRNLHHLRKAPQDDGELGCRDGHGRSSLVGSRMCLHAAVAAFLVLIGLLWNMSALKGGGVAKG